MFDGSCDLSEGLRARLLSVEDQNGASDGLDATPSGGLRRATSLGHRKRNLSLDDIHLDDILRVESPDAFKPRKGIAQTPLSFMDEFELINGVPAFVLEAAPEKVEDGECVFTCYAFSKDGGRLAAGDNHGMIRIWETNNFNLIEEQQIATGERVGCVSFLSGTNNILAASDIYGQCEHISIDQDDFFNWTIPSISEICIRCFIDNDDLAVQVAMDPDSRSAKIWPPRISADGCVIAQAISTRVEPQSFICDTRIFLSKTSYRNLQQTVIVSKGRSLVSRYCLSDNGTSLMVIFAPPQHHELAFIGSSPEQSPEHCMEVWPVVRFDDMLPHSFLLPCKMGKWANGGEYALGWTSGASNKPGQISVWKVDKLIHGIRRRRRDPMPLVSCPMESDDTIFHVELLSPSRGDGDDHVVLAICFAESGDAEIQINVWDSKEKAVMLTFDTRTPFKDTLVGRRQFLNQPGVMGYYWGHNELIMEDSLIKMCISPCKKWIAFYSSECNRGYLWSLKDAIPVARLSLPHDCLAEASLSIVKAMKTIAFNPSGSKLVLIGNNRMIAFVPAFLQSHRGLQMQHVHTSELKYVTYDAMHLSYDGSTLVLSGQEKPSNVSSFGKRFGPAFLDVTEGSHRAKVQEDVEASMYAKVPKDYALSKDGSIVGYIFVDNTVAIATVKSTSWDPKIELYRFLDDSHLKILSASREDILTRVFFATMSNGTEQLVCFSLLKKGCIYWFDIIHCQFIDRIPLSVDQSLGIKLTDGGSKAVILGTQAAQIVDLQNREITQSVNYNLSIPRARQMLAAEAKEGAQVFFSEDDGYEISGDGTMVLIGWDRKHKEPIYLNPGTRSSKLQRFVERAAEGVNTNVWLSNDSRWVIVAAEPGKHAVMQKGLIIYDTHKHRLPRVIPDDLDKTGCVPLFDISGDGRILVARSVFERNKNETTLFDVLLVLTPYAIEGSIPDYARLRMTQKTGKEDTIDKLIKEYSWPLLNYPDYEDKSLFQHALTNRMSNWVAAFYELGKQQSIPINLYWKEDAESGKPVEKNALQWAIDSRTADLVWDQLHRLVQKATTVNATASIIRSCLPDLYTYFPAIFMKLMECDMLIARFGKTPVAVRIFEQDKFLVGTDSNDISWREKGSSKLMKLWRSMGRSLEAAESNDGKKKAEIEAESKFVLVKDIAQVGMRGIIRYLLMLDAPADVFKTEIMKWTIAFKWQAYGLRMCLTELGTYLLFLGIFTTYAILLGRTDSFDNDEKEGWLIGIPLVMTLPVAISNMQGEWIQYTRYRSDSLLAFNERNTGRIHYARSQWNWIEMLSYLILIPLPFIHVLAIYKDVVYAHLLSALVAVEALLLWFKVLYFAQAFRVSGPLVIAVRQVVIDVFVFIGLVFMILFGFGVAFTVLFRHTAHSPSLSDDTAINVAAGEGGESDEGDDEDSDDSFSDIRNSLLTMFNALLGDFDIDVYRNAEALSWLTTTFFVLYMLAMMITLLNLLIGVMGDSFDKVRSQEEAEFLKGRASVIDDFEAGMSEREIKKLEAKIGTYLHALLPLEVPQELDTWAGKVKALEKAVGKKLDERNSHMNNELKSIKDSIEELKRVMLPNT